MYAAQKDCVWYEQCGAECCYGCCGYTPADSSQADMEFYEGILEENVQEYRGVIRDYSDGRYDCES